MQLREKLNKIIGNEYGLVWCFSMAMLFCITYKLWIAFDVHKSVDPVAYWGLAKFEFQQGLARKYRIILPFFIGALNWLLVYLIHLFAPNRGNGDFPMYLTHYCVNLGITAAYCTLVYYYLRKLGKRRIASLMGPCIIIVSSWTAPLTAEFMVDTFFCCFLTMSLIAIATKNTRLVFWMLMLGLFVKENFMFMIPVLFLFSHVPKWKSLIWIVIAAAAVFSFRFIYDRLTGHPPMESLHSDAENFTYLITNSVRFTERFWQQDMLATVGIWWVIPIAAGLLVKGFGRQLAQDWKGYMWMWSLMVLFQMFLAGDLSRFLYLILPVYSVFIASAVDYYLKVRASFINEPII